MNNIIEWCTGSVCSLEREGLWFDSPRALFCNSFAEIKEKERGLLGWADAGLA